LYIAAKGKTAVIDEYGVDVEVVVVYLKVIS
jgi:hypothetical protein